MQMKRVFVLTAITAVIAASGAAAQPTFSKSFSPSTIGPGSTSTLIFSIGNNSGVGVRGLAFTDNLPAGVTIATPANASSSCGGSLSAPDGGSTISLSDGQVGAGSACTVSVDVTSSTPGTHSNISGDLTSDAGNSGPASADLVIATDRPGFSKSFSPSTVPFGGRSTLTFLIDNTANADLAANLTFVDNLPSNMSVASPANASTTCSGGNLNAVDGAAVISYGPVFFGDATVGAGASCTVTVDVTGGAAGVLTNVSGELTSTTQFGGVSRSSGSASDQLTVTANQIALTKSFTDDPAAPGGTVDLQFELRNLSRGSTATGISFTDDLGAVLAGLEATGLPANDICGTGSSISGTGVLSFSGGELAAGASCTFNVTLDVPAAAAAGTYTNITSIVTATIDGNQALGAEASDLLFIQAAPQLTKTFLDNPVGSGGSTELEFTITNSDASLTMTDIAFVDELPTVLVSASATPPNGFCGPDSTLTFTPLIDATTTIPATISVANAELAAGTNCTFSVTLDVNGTASPGNYDNVTSEVSATVDGEAATGAPATDTLEIVAPPVLLKEFINNPVASGGTAMLEFTITYDTDGDGVIDFDVSSAASNIAFSDNLEAVISGLAPAGALPTDPCGTGSLLTFGGGNLMLSGGSLDPTNAGNPTDTCVFVVDLAVPAGTASGVYTNTTSNIVAEVGGLATTGNSATADLNIAGLVLSKEFTDDPVIAGGTVNLRFTIDNTSATENATNIVFTDNLNDVISGMAATGLPALDICGAGSQISAVSGSTFLQFVGGSLAAGASCTFDVSVDVPAGAASDTYFNITSVLTATMDGTPNVVFDAADAPLVVASDILSLDKEFIDDPTPPGGMVTLRFTLSNSSVSTAVTGISFTDDLDAVISGLESVSGTQNDICGLGSSISGTSLLTFSGGDLAAGDFCIFDVVLQVPSDAALGTVALNTTSSVTGSAASGGAVGDPASDNLEITSVAFSKSFDDVGQIGGTVGLTFTIENVSPTDSLTNLSFTDDLDAVVSGLAAIGLPTADVCGMGSSISGTSLITLTDGNLLPGGSCTFTVDLQVPAGATPGDYLNVTSELRQGGLVSAEAASATLTVVEPIDTDGDGVFDFADVCPDTVIPEGVPTQSLGQNRYALVDGDGIFDTNPPPGGSPYTFTIEDTAGCSCEQIIEELDLGNAHTRFGCSVERMLFWVDSVGNSVENNIKAPGTKKPLGRPGRGVPVG